MNRFIVITSIFRSTRAVDLFSELDGYEIIVVGDRKSPVNYGNDKVRFISIYEQQNLPFSLGKFLPYNHYCRKNLGYLSAMKLGADVIIDTDDDNEPYSYFNYPPFSDRFEKTEENKGFINIYSMFSDQFIWPRGYPLNKLNSNMAGFDCSESDCNIGIWQGLADGDPDVDAIYRLVFNKSCIFKIRPPIVLGTGTISPFNSQNTAFRKELFPLLYLPSTVTFRFTDILRGLVAQPILWIKGYLLGFTKATVVQQRNPHDYMKDFISEIPSFIHSEKVIEIVSGVISEELSVEENLLSGYLALLEHKIVEPAEIPMVESWINDVKKYV